MAVLRRQMTIDLSQDMFFSSEDLLKHGRHPLAAVQGQDIKRRVWDNVLRSARRRVCWISESRDLPKSFAGLIQTFSDKTAKSLKFNAPDAYKAHVLLWNSTEKRKRYMISHGRIPLEILLVGAPS